MTFYHTEISFKETQTHWYLCRNTLFSWSDVFLEFFWVSFSNTHLLRVSSTSCYFNLILHHQCNKMNKMSVTALNI